MVRQLWVSLTGIALGFVVLFSDGALAGDLADALAGQQKDHLGDDGTAFLVALLVVALVLLALGILGIVGLLRRDRNVEPRPSDPS